MKIKAINRTVLCLITLVCLVFAGFTAMNLKPQTANAEEAGLRQVAQWSGVLNFENAATINEVATKGYAWYKEAATGTPYGDVSANTLVLDGINLIATDAAAILFNSLAASTGYDATVLMAEGSKNTIINGEYSAAIMRNNLGSITFNGNGFLEGFITDSATYSNGIYSNDFITQNSGEIYVKSDAKTSNTALGGVDGVIFNGGKLTAITNPSTPSTSNYMPFYYGIIITNVKFIKFPIAAVYIPGGMRPNVYESDGTTLAKTVILDSAVCAHETTETRNAVVATCILAGYTGDTVCTVCNETLVTGTAVAKLSHVFGEWKITTEPTATTAGERARTCTLCKTTFTESVAALGETIGGGPAKGLSAGAIVGITVGSIVLLLIAVYFLGYLFLYRKNKLGNHKVKVIYSFLPKPNGENSENKDTK